MCRRSWRTSGRFFPTVVTRVAWIVCLAQLSCSAAPPPPPATRPASQLNLLAMGDWGEGRPAQKKVADAMADYVEQSHTRFSALISAGDNFYVPLSSTNDPTWQTLFEKMYDPRRLDFPFFISLGNHDYDQNKYRIEFAYAREHPESRWKQPGRWYRIDLPAEAPLVTIIILDSNHDDLTKADWAEQDRFLEDELTKPRATWTMCVAHHPLFSNGLASDNGILQRDWGALFQKYNVDFYLCGHEHNLQHIEVAGWKPSFILAGGGGAHSHPIVHDNRGPFSRSIYGFVHFDFTPEKAIVHYIGADGQPVHVFERTKAGEVQVMMTTPSDPRIAKPLEVIQGIYDKLHPAETQPASK
jgi:tartrate-resistant acid phosphatase type 5